MHAQPYDLIIIGSGAGTKLALPAAQLGLRVALVEEGAFGGTCLNRGCIPSKMLIYPAEVVELTREAAKLGVAGLDHPRPDFRAVIGRVSSAVDAISLENRETHAGHANLTLIRGHARFVADRTVRVNDEVLTAPRLFLAPGARPHIPNIDGLAGTPFMTSTEALRNPVLPRRLLVLGSGIIAAELGFAYGAFGSEVHVLARSRMLRLEDSDVAAEFARVFRRRHVIHEGFTARTVAHRNGVFTVEGTDPSGVATRLDGDALLVATGVTPNTNDLGLEHTGLKLRAEGSIVVDDHLRTSVDGVYALGDCIGRHLFRHTANFEGEYLMRSVVRGETDAPIDYGPVPHAIFAHPQVAGVGAREDDLRARGVPVLVGKATYAASTPGEARLADHGFVKVLVDPGSDRLLGAQIVGPEAATLVHLFIAMMKKSGTLQDLLDMIFIHPALPEVARDAARDAATRRPCPSRPSASA